MRRRHSGSGAEDDSRPASSQHDGNGRADERSTKHRSLDDRGQEARQEEEVTKKDANSSHTTRRRSAESFKDAGTLEDETFAKRTTRGASTSPARRRSPAAAKLKSDMLPDLNHRHHPRLRSPWSCSKLTLVTSLISLLIVASIGRSFLLAQLDPKGCEMSYMRDAYAKFDDFDTEHTRFATKYSLYLYREGGVDEDTRVKGIPVLFIPGNAGSYKQVRPIAAEAAYHFQDNLQNDEAALAAGKRPLDFFSVDFNEDITAFHGQTLLDQADYLNDAISYILKLYHDPQRSLRDPSLPDPTSVIIIGHSMGGVVARTMVTRSNYVPNSINTIITLSAPHARAPVSFDADIVRIYEGINKYWRMAYSQQWASKNPLWHVTLVSIAGGGLDNVVPSDYASLSSLVPETHGFAVFTSSIPHVWTGMDHLAIMWCDQFRKAVIRALFDVVDVTRPSQTRSRSERITKFRRHFLTGMEPVIEKQLPEQESKILLTLEDETTTLSTHDERLVLSSLGKLRKTAAHMLPIPTPEPHEEKRLTILTDQSLDRAGLLEVYLCGVRPHQHAQLANNQLDLVKGGTNRLACRSAAADVVSLPASRTNSQYAFDQSLPFSYLEYDLADIAEYNFVAVVDRASESREGWLVAEFASTKNSTTVSQKSLPSLLTSGMQHVLPVSRPLVNSIHLPVIHSSLLAYKLSVRQTCAKDTQLFQPLLRQYILQPYETKFFPNVAGEININLHGVSPYVSPPSAAHHAENGLSLQLWSDPSCNGTTTINLKVDLYGSAGKLYMRYRTVFAAFPLLVVALVIRKQFKIYNAKGVFISFTESMDLCIRTSLPLIFVALTFLSLSLVGASTRHTPLPGTKTAGQQHSPDSGAAMESVASFTQNELLLGTYDPFFWFLVPLFGLVSVGVCTAFNYAVLLLVHIFSMGLSFVSRWRADDSRRPLASFSPTSSLQRLVTTGVLVLLVATVIPYQFAYLVLCIVQLITCVRALRQAIETRTQQSASLYNYTHSLLILLVWILPINIPVLVVWIHNLAVPYLTPFSSHHNIASIAPYILLVETVSTGHMIPRLTGTQPRLVTNALLFAVAVWAAVYGVTWAYTLHYAVNGVCAWLFVVHVLGGSASNGAAAPAAASGGSSPSPQSAAHLNGRQSAGGVAIGNAVSPLGRVAPLLGSSWWSGGQDARRDDRGREKRP